MRIVDVRCRPSYPGFRELFRPSWAKERLGAPVVQYVDSRDEFVALLDAEGIELCVVTGRGQTSRDGRAFKNSEIAALGAQYPARIIRTAAGGRRRRSWPACGRTQTATSRDLSTWASPARWCSQRVRGCWPSASCSGAATPWCRSDG